MPPQQQVLPVPLQRNAPSQQQQVAMVVSQSQINVLQQQLQGLQLQQPQVVAAPQTLQQLLQLVPAPTDTPVMPMAQPQSYAATDTQAAALQLLQARGGVAELSQGLLVSSGCSPVKSSVSSTAFVTAAGAPLQFMPQQQPNLLSAVSLGSQGVPGGALIAQGVSAAYPVQQQPLMVLMH